MVSNHDNQFVKIIQEIIELLLYLGSYIILVEHWHRTTTSETKRATLPPGCAAEDRLLPRRSEVRMMCATRKIMSAPRIKESI